MKRRKRIQRIVKTIQKRTRTKSCSEIELEATSCSSFPEEGVQEEEKNEPPINEFEDYNEDEFDYEECYEHSGSSIEDIA